MAPGTLTWMRLRKIFQRPDGQALGQNGPAKPPGNLVELELLKSQVDGDIAQSWVKGVRPSATVGVCEHGLL